MSLDLFLDFLIGKVDLVLEVDIFIHLLELGLLLSSIKSNQLSKDDIAVVFQSIELPVSISNFSICQNLQQ
jgi:hypothetical protein